MAVVVTEETTPPYLELLVMKILAVVEVVMEM
jgi:hypothetical protein